MSFIHEDFRIEKKKGTKRHILEDGRGILLAVIVTGANRHDVTQVEAVLDNVVANCPELTAEKPQHLCADKAFDSAEASEAMEDRGYSPTSALVVRCDGKEPRFRGIVHEDGLSKHAIRG
jgi:hypothetical protein